jgi:lipopolysaccharide export system permease protein
MLKIFDRYLLKEVLQGWLAVTLVLLIVLFSDWLVRFLSDAANGDIPGGVVFTLLGLKMIWFQVLVVPFALALGVMLALGRINRDHEMVVMEACGIGPGRIYRPLLAFGVLVALVLAWLSLYVSPEVQGMSNSLKSSARQTAELTVLGAGRFNNLQDGKVTFYAESLSADRKQMENLFIVVHDKGHPEHPAQMITARTATRQRDPASGDDFLVLQDGYRYYGRPGAADYRIMQFASYGVRVDLPDIAPRETRREEIPSAQLIHSSDPWDVAELQWRIAMPLSVVTLLLLAVPLSRSGPRQAGYGRLVLAILLFLIYYNLLGTARMWVGKGILPPLVGLWWVPLLPVLLTFLLYKGGSLACRFGWSR